MVHHRINERETNPNKHINFISALQMPGVPAPYSEEDARQLLRALAAQVRPVMKNHGFEVNSFEEYEYNRVFAGRNWNAGEVIELVLRNFNGMFVPTSWLMSTLCHELAHIKHMNHGPSFQKLWAQLRSEVKALQDKGYFGDGYWSSGTRLCDSEQVGGQGTGDMDLPEYICGGAQQRARPKASNRRGRNPAKEAGSSKRRKPKPGARVRTKGKFKGEGLALNADISDEDEKKKGTGFRKQASSKRAREARFLAVQKRLQSLQGTSMKEEGEEGGFDHGGDVSSDTEEDTDDDASSPETDENRLKTMRESMKGTDELDGMRTFMKQYLEEFSGRAKPSVDGRREGKEKALDLINIPSDDDYGGCGLSSTSSPVDAKADEDASSERPLKRARTGRSPSAHISGPIGQASSSKTDTKFNNTTRRSGNGVSDKAVRKPESLASTKEMKSGTESAPSDRDRLPSSLTLASTAADKFEPELDTGWSCLVCTLENLPQHLACSACATPRGETSWNAPSS